MSQCLNSLAGFSSSCSWSDVPNGRLSATAVLKLRAAQIKAHTGADTQTRIEIRRQRREERRERVGAGRKRNKETEERGEERKGWGGEEEK